MRKLTVLVDMDDTIENLLTAWVACLNDRHSLCVRTDDIEKWDLAESFPSLSPEEVYAPLYENAFWETVRPKPDAVEYLKQIKNDGHELYIVTASVYHTLPAKMERVLFRYFPYLEWKDVIVTSNKQMVRGDVLVDDGPHNLEGGEYHKILVDAPHNRNYDARANGMTRVYSWKGAYRAICRLAEGGD